MSRMPINEAPCLCLRSRALLILWTNHLNRRSYVALAKASTAKSAWRKQDHTVSCRPPQSRKKKKKEKMKSTPVPWSEPSEHTLVQLWSWGSGWPGWTPARWCQASGTVSAQPCYLAWRPDRGSSLWGRRCCQTAARLRWPWAWLQGRCNVIHPYNTQEKKAGAFLGTWFLHSFSSGMKPIIPMESMVWVKLSESLWPGTGIDPPLRKRYWSAVPKRSSAKDKEKGFKLKLGRTETTLFHKECLTALCQTSCLLGGPTQHLVEDVECPFVFGLPGGAGLFKEVFIQAVMDWHNKNPKVVVLWFYCVHTGLNIPWHTDRLRFL